MVGSIGLAQTAAQAPKNSKGVIIEIKGEIGPTVAAFLFSFVVATIAKTTGDVDLRALGSNEMREFYVAVFLSSYLLSLWYRMRQ